MADLFGVTIDQQIACVDREIALRKRVYARWVMTGKMPQEKADTEIAHMEAVATTLRAVQATAPNTAVVFGA